MTRAERRTAELKIRLDPRRWFEHFGVWLDDENSRAPTTGPANVLQRRVFEHYRRCLEERKPCRAVVLKYRRAGSSTACSAVTYCHAMNFTARLGVIGTDYKASSNMMDMVKVFGKYDRFAGWTDDASKAGDSFSETREVVPWEWDDLVEKEIATKVKWKHGASIELYTAKNPHSARSAGLTGFHGTECAHWPSTEAMNATETLNAMVNTLPKKGFHVAFMESTAKGAEGAFYDTCRAARWPEYADWWKKWQTDFPLEKAEAGPDLQWVFIFAAWFEDNRNFISITEERAKRIEATLDVEPQYDGERDLIARYGEEGPKGLRLGSEVDATVWEQLEWRRAIIDHYCKKDLQKFKREYPSNPLEAFQTTGTAVFNQEGITALETAQRLAKPPDWGYVDRQPSGRRVWRRTRETEGVFCLWEQPIVGARYLVTVDPMSGASLVTGQQEKDCHSVLVLRDAFVDTTGNYYPVKLVARIKAPCRWDNKPLAAQIAELSELYGRAVIVVESNIGIALITTLRDDHHCSLYVQQDWDSTKQAVRTRLGWRNDEPSRRQAVATGQDYVREEKIEMLCPRVLAEMKTFIINEDGKATASSGAHDDDVLALIIGLTCIHAATTYREEEEVHVKKADGYREVG